MAAAKVLATTELLETILLNLPMRDILRGKAVASDWKQTIEKSIKLKKASFLVADGNPIARCSPPDQEYLKKTAFQFNPLFRSMRDSTRTGKTYLGACGDRPYPIGNSRTTTYEIVRNSHCLSIDEGIKLPTVFRAMFLTQPPITICEAGVLVQNWHRRATIFDTDGITLGAVADTLVRLFQQLIDSVYGAWRTGTECPRLEADEINLSKIRF